MLSNDREFTAFGYSLPTLHANVKRLFAATLFHPLWHTFRHFRHLRPFFVFHVISPCVIPLLTRFCVHGFHISILSVFLRCALVLPFTCLTLKR